MSKAVSRWIRSSRRNDRPQSDSLKPGEYLALKKIRNEAKEKGSYLASNGKGGLPPSLVLGVLRRDGYRCKRCGMLGDKNENGGISLHHRGGIVASKWLSKKGHSNDPNNIVTICDKCHNEIHEEAKKEGIDSSQITPEGDK